MDRRRKEAFFQVVDMSVIRLYVMVMIINIFILLHNILINNSLDRVFKETELVQENQSIAFALLKQNQSHLL